MKLSSAQVVDPISEGTATNLHFNVGITIGLLDVLHVLEIHPGGTHEHLPPVGQMEVALAAAAYKDKKGFMDK